MRVIRDRDLFGFSSYALPIPDFAFTAIVILAALSFVILVYRLSMAVIRDNRSFAFNGLMAYAISLYPWLFIDKINLVYFALVPAFHSLQYLTVVWRYELNSINQKNAKRSPEEKSPWPQFFTFYGVAALLGLMGFWLVPLALEIEIPVDKTIFTGSIFLFVFWVFINIHHYLLDNVMWRKGNPDVAEHLFVMKPNPSAKS